MTNLEMIQEIVAAVNELQGQCLKLEEALAAEDALSKGPHEPMMGPLPAPPTPTAPDQGTVGID